MVPLVDFGESATPKVEPVISVSLHTVDQRFAEPPSVIIFKVVDHLHPLYRPYIEASPFAVLATLGPQGLDHDAARGRR